MLDDSIRIIIVDHDDGPNTESFTEKVKRTYRPRKVKRKELSTSTKMNIVPYEGIPYLSSVLPPETILYIVDYLDIASVLSFASSFKLARDIIDEHYWSHLWKTLSDNQPIRETLLPFLKQLAISKATNLCANCRKKTSASRYWKNVVFCNAYICHSCSEGEGTFHMISKTMAKKIYHLTDLDLESILYSSTTNQYRITCRYYWETDVKNLTYIVHGSKEAFEHWKEKCRRTAMKRASNKSIKMKKLEQEIQSRRLNLSNRCKEFGFILRDSTFVESWIVMRNPTIRHFPMDKIVALLWKANYAYEKCNFAKRWREFLQDIGHIPNNDYQKMKAAYLDSIFFDSILPNDIPSPLSPFIFHMEDIRDF